MSHAFVGIEDPNEFFTQHYLAAILQGDLKPVLTEWREKAEQRKAAQKERKRTKVTSASFRPPPQALGAHHRDFFDYLDKLATTKGAEARVQAHRDTFVPMLVALGYEPRRELVELPSGHLPLLVSLNRADGAPLLWCVPVATPFGAEAAPTLSRQFLHEQLAEANTDAANVELRFPDATVEDLVTEAFGLDEPPRFILVCGERDIVLLERAKWAEQRLLIFDLEEILGRRQADTLDVTAALLHRTSLVGEQGSAALIDNLDDSSHKHAFAVSEDLKYALQACIERLGNAAITQIRDKQRTQKKKLHGEDIAAELSRECLRYMYRLLFLFYIEARPELGYVPLGSDAYRFGYSLERLRELEQIDLQTDEARRGTYIHESLELLFRMIHEGCRPAVQAHLVEDKDGRLTPSHHGTFELQPLRSHLFDPARTPLLSNVKFDNEVLRDVVEWMSLTRGGARSSAGSPRRGRISYATLGINQLGAVYEALLSFRGFFAETDLYEVKPAKEKDHDVLKTAYFVPEAELDKYDEAERVYATDNKTLKKYAAGTFIYRLAGRDRQTSASYYTPESLTKAVVKYALKELLEDEGGQPKLTADEILKLTVCEPAMGSAAFLNEAVNQLAEAYLQAKQRELNDRIPHDRYVYEKQRVKMFIADNNVFGVDLNPIAVELAEVSLWLNTIHEGGFVPWFGGQTVCGNSLIGARRQVFTAATIDAGRDGKRADYLDTVPDRVPLGTDRPKGSVYHFLLGDRSMSVYGEGNEGKPIRDMAGAALEKLDAWRTEFCSPVDEDDRQALVELSDAIDRLWVKHAELLKRVRERTTDPIEVYGRPLAGGARTPTTTAEKDAIWEGEMESKEVRAASPYRRLKLAMDYWCALWFWPIEEADLIPDRDEFLADLALLLDTNVLLTLQGDAQGDLFAPTMPAREAEELAKELGVVDVDKLVARSSRLQVVQRLAEQQRFLHWELEFADVFRSRGGFDLTVGNPPWVKVEWRQSDVLGDALPLIALRSVSSDEVDGLRAGLLREQTVFATFARHHEATYGAQAFLRSIQNYSELGGGVRVNLYKCFLPAVWRTMSHRGVAGLLHPEGVYDDPNGGVLRENVYLRLRRHYHFYNELKLFPIGHTRPFSVNVYGPQRSHPKFVHIANLFSPGTIDACHSHIGAGDVPGMKDPDGSWVLRGHKDRVIDVTGHELALYAELYDEPGISAVRARLPAVHSKTLHGVLSRLRSAATIDQLDSSWCTTPLWHERHARRDGIIRRGTGFADVPSETIVSGPHFYVANPLYKSARTVCTKTSHYDSIDLAVISDDYLPRTNYRRACEHSAFMARTTKVPWGSVPSPVTDYARVVAPQMIDPRVERTLQAAIVPPGVGHIHQVISYAFQRRADLVRVAASWASLVADFFIKSTGASHFNPNLARRVPLASSMLEPIAARALVLNCLTKHYADLWQACFVDSFSSDRWTKDDARLGRRDFAALRADWTPLTPLRTRYRRRQALLEIDVLVAMSLGITLGELKTIYRTQFYVLRQNDAETWWDRTGRIVFTVSRGLSGVGLPRTTPRSDATPAWNEVKDMKSGTVEHVIIDDTLPGGPVERTIVYEAPFDRCDREHDYEVAWAHFAERFGEQAEAAS